jgi:hypothetical protein
MVIVSVTRYNQFHSMLSHYSYPIQVRKRGILPAALVFTRVNDHPIVASEMN